MEGPDGPPPSVVGAADTVGIGIPVGFPAPLSPPPGCVSPPPGCVGIVVGLLEGLVVGAIVAMQLLAVPNLSQAKLQSGAPSKQPMPRTNRPSRLSMHWVDTKSGLI
jgi:hypothetical protein